MTLTLDLNPDTVARLKAEAARRSIPMENIIQEIVAVTLPEADITPNPEAMEIARRIIQDHRKTWDELSKY